MIERGFWFTVSKMFSWIRRHFVPHTVNDNRPHFLRGNALHLTLLVALLLEFAVFATPLATMLGGSRFTAAVLPAVLSDLTNQKRSLSSLQPLKVNPILQRAAQLKADDMAKKGYFAHTSPEGKTPWSFLKQVGYEYEYAGENLAVNFYDSQDVTNAWMNSPSHRANIERGVYREVGSAVAVGNFRGQPAIFAVQMYASPAVYVPIYPASNVSANSNSAAAYNSVAPKFFERILSSPHRTTNIILLSVAALILLAILLKLLVKTNVKHPHLITNGLVALVIIFGIYIATDTVVRAGGNIQTSHFESFESSR